MSRLVRFAGAALLAAAPLAPASAQAPARVAGETSPAALPDGALGRAARLLLDAAAEADSAAVARVLDAVMSPASRQPRAEIAGYLRAFREQAGGVSVGGARTTARGNLVLELWGREIDAGVELVLFRDAADSTRLERVTISRSLRRNGGPPSFPRERMSDHAIAAVLESELRRLEAADQLSGVVLVARGDTVVYEGTFGVESPPSRAPMTTRSRFHLASVGKMFTATVIAQLVQEGRVSLDDTVGELLPGHPWTDAARGITLRQLLSHTSGLGTLFDRPAYDANRVYATATERLAVFAAEPLLFAPGERYGYSNEGYETLAAIAERLTGTRFNDLVRERIFAPAGMTTIALDAPADTVTDRAFPSPHAADDPFGVRPRVSRSLGWSGGGAGGGHASARDLFRFARALVTGRLVDRALVDTLVAGDPLPRPNDGYAYGMMSRDVDGRLVFGHSGGGPRGYGICNDVDVFADGSWTVVVATNFDAPFCGTLKAEISAMLARS